MNKNFINKGFTDIIYISAEQELTKLQNLIYLNTKDLLIDHEKNISINQKLNLNFKKIPSPKNWSNLMNVINESHELKSLINSEGIKQAFKKIFVNPEPFEISTFRARIPNQKRVIYNWHQDEGTWYLSKNKNHLNKYPATLWFSINGAEKNDTIQLVEHSHQKKLYNHKFVSGQGFFNIDKKNIINEKNIYTVVTQPSEGIIFHPLTLHRSVPNDPMLLRPRYTIDIRYFDKNYKPKFEVDFKFRVKKFFT